MKRLRGKLTYANVISTLAMFLVLAGGTAFATTKLAKNSVGTKQIKNNAITGAKIKNEAVTGVKINLSSLGTVPSASNANHATTADTASNANHATTADTAINASHSATAVHAQTADVASSANAIAAPEAFREVGKPGQPAFNTGWGNFGSERPPAAFYLDREGVVHLQGELSGNNTTALVFTLPAGYRPEEQQAFPTTGNGGVFATITINPAGEVTAGDKILTYLNGITFRAGQ